MKKWLLVAFLSSFYLTAYNLYAEEAQTPAASEPVVSEETAVPSPEPAVPQEPVASQPEAAVSTEAPAQSVAETPAPAESAAPLEEIVNTENLEFISGEVTTMDETAKTITVKLYGETENDTNQKILTVKVDETTDITDGEKDRDMKSLAAGTEVDVEYDPTTNKATYIFVY